MIELQCSRVFLPKIQLEQGRMPRACSGHARRRRTEPWSVLSCPKWDSMTSATLMVSATRAMVACSGPRRNRRADSTQRRTHHHLAPEGFYVCHPHGVRCSVRGCPRRLAPRTNATVRWQRSTTLPSSTDMLAIPTPRTRHDAATYVDAPRMMELGIARV